MLLGEDVGDEDELSRFGNMRDAERPRDVLRVDDELRKREVSQRIRAPYRRPLERRVFQGNDEVVASPSTRRSLSLGGEEPIDAEPVTREWEQRVRTRVQTVLVDEVSDDVTHRPLRAERLLAPCVGWETLKDAEQGTACGSDLRRELATRERDLGALLHRDRPPSAVTAS